MHKQFYEGVRTKDLIDALKPKLILEMGFGAGTNMLVLLTYTKKPGADYRIISLSDDFNVERMTLPNDFIDRFIFVKGISYAMVPRWNELGLPPPYNEKIDFCIIDTDHNYWTLQKELEYLDSIMADKCAIALHDTATKPCEHHLMYENALDKSSNSMMRTTRENLTKDVYPFDEVAATLDVPMMQAIDEFLGTHSDYKKIKHFDECCGCTVLGRDFDYE